MFLKRRFYFASFVVILLLASGYWFAPLFVVGKIALVLWLLLTVCDILLLYALGGRITAHRQCASRFSNGDDNEVKISMDNTYPFRTYLMVIDEIPFVFQRRDLEFHLEALPRMACEVNYKLHPVERGEYGFGLTRVFATTWLGLVARRFSTGEKQTVKVYPSYLMLRHYEFLAVSQNLTEIGIKRIRRIGNQSEFDQIKEYVQGNDYRTINWKATARRHQLMVNIYRDERSQQIYNVIDKGRVMQQAFGGMTLLDYAINASLVLSYVAVRREDKAGLVTFADRFETWLPASSQQGQMQQLSEMLYKEETTFGETDYSSLCVHLNKYVSKRSLLVLYTNFATLVEVKRQLPYLQNLSRKHCLLVVFFKDDDVEAYARSQADNTEEYYRHVIADKFIYEKRQIVNLLKQYGIMALLTSPQRLSVNVINQYIEIKSRQLI